MAVITLYHNQNCSTSRKARARLEEAGAAFDVVEYLKHPLSKAELGRLVDAIDSPPADLVRKDPKFKELGLDAADYTSKAAVVQLLTEHPELMQRPVVVKGEVGLIGRPVERVDELL